MNDLPAPSPHFRTVQLRVPVVSRGIILAVVCGLLAVGGLAWGGYHLYQTHAATTQARAEIDAAARELAARDNARLDSAEETMRALSLSVDKGIAADSSDAVNVNGYLDGQGRLRAVFAQVGPDVDAFASRPEAPFLSSDRRRDLDALRHRADADGAQLAALDPRIQQAAQHRQKLAQAEDAAAKAAKAAAARRAAAEEAASTPPPPPASTVYYDASPSPYYYNGYGYPYAYGGPTIWFGGSWGGHGHGGWHGGGHHR